MDLPTCPTCGQSVIDDDAAECPFCGAPMSGGGAAKPSAPATPGAGKPGAGKSGAARKGQPAGQSRAAAGQAGGGPAADVPVDPDDPFAVASTAHMTAVPSVPKPAKGRTYKVTCPMCETVGFVPRKAAGKDVKCANPQCLVPVFKAPAIEQPKDEGADAGAAGGKSRPMVIGIAVAALLAVGVGSYFMFFAGGDDDSVKGPGPTFGPGTGASTDPDTDPDQPVDEPGPGDPTNVKPTVSVAQIQKQALDRMVIVAREKDKNRSKAFCRQLTAESYAYTGDFAATRREMDQLVINERALAHYRIRPLVVMAWKQLDAGDTASAQKTLTEARQMATLLPKYGRDQVDLATQLASVLVATGQTAEAWSLLRTHRSDEPAEAALTADLIVIRAFEAMNRPALQMAQIQPWSEPQQVAVAVELAIRGRTDRISEWAGRMRSDLNQAETLAAVAQVLGQASQLGVDDALTKLHALQPPASIAAAAQVWIKASAAVGAIQAGGTETAERLASEALAAFNALPEPPAFIIDDEKALLKADFDNVAAAEAGLKAGAVLTQLESLLSKTDEAWNVLQKSMVFARAMAPSPVVSDDVLAEAERSGLARLSQKFQRSMGLDNTEAGRTATRYIKKCRDMKAAADRRFQMQTDLLEQAAFWGLHEQIWGWAQQQHALRNTRLREAFLATAVPWYLGTAYQRAGNQAGAREIVQAVASVKLDQETVIEDRLRIDVLALVSAGKYLEAGRRLEQQDRVKESWRVRFSQKLLDEILDQKQLDNALALVEGVRSRLWREEALNYVASRATRAGMAEQVWKHSNNRDWVPTERISWMRGLVVGIAVQGDQTASTPAAAGGDVGE